MGGSEIGGWGTIALPPCRVYSIAATSRASIFPAFISPDILALRCRKVESANKSDKQERRPITCQLCPSISGLVKGMAYAINSHDDVFDHYVDSNLVDSSENTGEPSSYAEAYEHSLDGLPSPTVGSDGVAAFSPMPDWDLGHDESAEEVYFHDTSVSLKHGFPALLKHSVSHSSPPKRASNTRTTAPGECDGVAISSSQANSFAPSDMQTSRSPRQRTSWQQSWTQRLQNFSFPPGPTAPISPLRRRRPLLLLSSLLTSLPNGTTRTRCPWPATARISRACSLRSRRSSLLCQRQSGGQSSALGTPTTRRPSQDLFQLHDNPIGPRPLSRPHRSCSRSQSALRHPGRRRERPRPTSASAPWQPIGTRHRAPVGGRP